MLSWLKKILYTPFTFVQRVFSDFIFQDSSKQAVSLKNAQHGNKATPPNVATVPLENPPRTHSNSRRKSPIAIAESNSTGRVLKLEPDIEALKKTPVKNIFILLRQNKSISMQENCIVVLKDKIISEQEISFAINVYVNLISFLREKKLSSPIELIEAIIDQRIEIELTQNTDPIETHIKNIQFIIPRIPRWREKLIDYIIKKAITNYESIDFTLLLELTEIYNNDILFEKLFARYIKLQADNPDSIKSTKNRLTNCFKKYSYLTITMKLNKDIEQLTVAELNNSVNSFISLKLYSIAATVIEISYHKNLTALDYTNSITKLIDRLLNTMKKDKDSDLSTEVILSLYRMYLHLSVAIEEKFKRYLELLSLPCCEKIDFVAFYEFYQIHYQHIRFLTSQELSHCAKLSIQFNMPIFLLNFLRVTTQKSIPLPTDILGYYSYINDLLRILRSLKVETPEVQILKHHTFWLLNNQLNWAVQQTCGKQEIKKTNPQVVLLAALPVLQELCCPFALFGGHVIDSLHNQESHPSSDIDIMASDISSQEMETQIPGGKWIERRDGKKVTYSHHSQIKLDITLTSDPIHTLNTPEFRKNRVLTIIGTVALLEYDPTSGVAYLFILNPPYHRNKINFTCENPEKNFANSANCTRMLLRGLRLNAMGYPLSNGTFMTYLQKHRKTIRQELADYEFEIEFKKLFGHSKAAMHLQLLKDHNLLESLLPALYQAINIKPALYNFLLINLLNLPIDSTNHIYVKCLFVIICQTAGIDDEIIKQSMPTFPQERYVKASNLQQLQGSLNRFLKKKT